MRPWSCWRLSFSESCLALLNLIVSFTTFEYSGLILFVFPYKMMCHLSQLIPWLSLSLSTTNELSNCLILYKVAAPSPQTNHFSISIDRIMFSGRLNIQLLCSSLCFVLLSCSAFTTQEYADALEKSILFFEGQRSGKLPSNQRLTWRADSALSDGSGYHVTMSHSQYQLGVSSVFNPLICFQVDLVGGYYDAGDNMKFGLPMAFTTTLLAWSVIEFGSSMGNELDNAHEAVRWGADYLLKAATATPGALYVQVSPPSL